MRSWQNARTPFFFVFLRDFEGEATSGFFGIRNDNRNGWVDKDDDMIWQRFALQSKTSPTGPTERTPKPEYLIALAFSLRVRW